MGIGFSQVEVLDEGCLKFARRARPAQCHDRRGEALSARSRAAGGQDSLIALGLSAGVPACTDLTTKPWVQEAGVEVLDQPFFARGKVATAGGCFASPYLAAWILARSEGHQAAAAAQHDVAPVGEKDAYVAHAMGVITPYMPAVD
ncbi:MAG: hypothetical protein RL722_1253 [Pseudomonadota bacterium]|jgi:hypothetical protein